MALRILGQPEFGWRSRFGPTLATRVASGPPSAGPPSAGAQTLKRLGPRRVGPRGWGAQNFALFFPSPRPHFHSFFLSLGIFSSLFSLSGCLLVSFFLSFSRGILVVLVGGTSNVLVFAFRLS